MIDGPMYTGFIGPGMLTGAILGLDGSTTSVPTTDTIVEVVEHCVKDDKEAGNFKPLELQIMFVVIL